MHIKNLYENIGDKESLKDLDHVPREIVKPILDFLYVLNIWIRNWHYKRVGPRCSANPITVTPIWKWEFEN